MLRRSSSGRCRRHPSRGCGCRRRCGGRCPWRCAATARSGWTTASSATWWLPVSAVGEFRALGRLHDHVRDPACTVSCRGVEIVFLAAAAKADANHFSHKDLLQFNGEAAEQRARRRHYIHNGFDKSPAALLCRGSVLLSSGSRARRAAPARRAARRGARRRACRARRRGSRACPQSSAASSSRVALAVLQLQQKARRARRRGPRRSDGSSSRVRSSSSPTHPHRRELDLHAARADGGQQNACVLRAEKKGGVGRPLLHGLEQHILILFVQPACSRGRCRPCTRPRSGG